MSSSLKKSGQQVDLLQLRLMLQWTQDRMACVIGYSRSQLSLMESGKRPVPVDLNPRIHDLIIADLEREKAQIETATQYVANTLKTSHCQEGLL